MVDAEAALVTRALAGDDEAFEALVQPHLARAQRTAFLITHDSHAAADALQNALLRAYRSFQGFRPEHRFYPWFVRIVVNEAVKLAKSSARTAAPLADFPSNVTPEESLLVQEERKRVWDAIQTLRPHHRTVVVLRYYEDLSESEIADVLRISPGTVKSRLHYARAALESKLTSGSRSGLLKWFSARGVSSD